MMKTKRDYQKFKRDIRRKALNLDGLTEDSQQRVYTEATKTRRSVKTELFGNKSKGKDTYLEEFVRTILEDNDIKYVAQKSVKWCNYDFFVPDCNLLIECQGEYWHCDSRFYKEPKNDTQRKNLVKNKTKREIAVKANMFLVEIWENEIKNFPQEVKEGLLNLIKRN